LKLYLRKERKGSRGSESGWARERNREIVKRKRKRKAGSVGGREVERGRERVR